MEGDRLILSGTGRITAYGPELYFHTLEITEGITAIEKNAFRDHYELRESEDYPYYSDLHPIMWIRPSGELWLEDTDDIK